MRKWIDNNTKTSCKNKDYNFLNNSISEKIVLFMLDEKFLNKGHTL